MSEELELYSYKPVNEAVRPYRQDYMVNSGSGLPAVRLKRGTDFGVIPGTKKPSLYKAGAEKIATQYGLCQRYSIESKIEQADGKNNLFFYLVRCDLVKIIDGREYVITSAFGSANTNEKRNGFNAAWDAANSAVKMAQKRALVGAVIALSSGTGMFDQDMEDEQFMKNADAIVKTGPDDPISTKQITRLYAIAGEAGMTSAEAKQKIIAMGYKSTKEIKQKDYDGVIAALQEAGNGSNG
jgi:hypothetical protein